MSDICRWPALKLKMAIRLRQKTTTSTPSITSDRCSLALTRDSRPFVAGFIIAVNASETRLVAQKIIELSQRGVRDVAALQAMALKAFKYE